MRLAFFLLGLSCAGCAGNPGVGIDPGRRLDLGLGRDATPGDDLGDVPDPSPPGRDAGTPVSDAGSASPDLGVVVVVHDAGTPDVGSGPSGAPTHAGQLVITEIMYDPGFVTDSVGEYFELYNPGTTALDVGGCTVDDSHYPSTGHTVAGSVAVPPHGYVSLADSTMPGFVPTYSYGAAFSLNNTGGDSVVLDCGGTVIDRVDYGTGWPNPSGASLQLSAATLDGTANDSASSWCVSTVPISSGDTDLGTPGAANRVCP